MMKITYAHICIVCLFCILIFPSTSYEIIGQEINLLEQAKNHYIIGDLSNSLKAVNEYLTIDPENASALNLQGIIFMDIGEYALAEQSLQKSLQTSPDDSRILFNLGLVSLYQRNYNQAEEFFDRSLLLNNSSADTSFNMGLTQYAMGKYDSAIESFRHSITIRPEDPAVWFNIGQAYEQNRDYNNSIIAYQKAIELNSTYAKPYFFTGYLYSRMGLFSEAVPLLKNYSHLQPEDDLGWFLYSRALNKIGEKNLSIEMLEKAIILNPDNNEYQKYHKLYTGDYNNTPFQLLYTPLSPSIIIMSLIIVSLIPLPIKRRR